MKGADITRRFTAWLGLAAVLGSLILPSLAAAAAPAPAVPITALPSDLGAMIKAEDQAILNSSKSKGGDVNDEWYVDASVASCSDRTHPAGSIYQYYKSTLGANPPVQPGDFQKSGSIAYWDCDFIVTYDTAYWYVSAADADWTGKFLTNYIKAYAKGDTSALSDKLTAEKAALQSAYDDVIPELANAWAAFQLLNAYAGMPAVKEAMATSNNREGLLCVKSDATAAQDCAADMLTASNAKRLHKPTGFASDLQDGSSSVTTSDDQAYQSTTDFYGDFSTLVNTFSDPSAALSSAAQATTLNGKMLAAAQGLDSSTSAASAVSQVDNRCGSATALLNPFQQLRYGICSFVDYANQLIDGFLVSSVSLLGVTSGIYGNFNASQAVNPSNFTVDGWNKTPISLDQNSFFGDLLPTSVSTPFQQVMVDNNTSIGRVVIDTTNLVLRVLNTLMITAFLLIALANILQVQLNVYNVRKLLPSVILGYILAFSSPFLMRAGLEVVSRVGQGVFEISRSIVSSDSTANQITTQNDFQYFADAISQVRGQNGSLCFTDDASGHPNTKGSCGNSFFDTLAAGTPLTQAGINDTRVAQQAVLGVFVAIGAVLIFVLGFLLMFRVFVFAILVPLAPLAVFSKFFPPLGVVWSRWWKTMSSWILMPIPIMFCLLLAFIYFAAANQPTSSGTTGNDQGLLAAIINYAAAVGILFAAIKLPFSMAGEAKAYLDKWNALGRWGWNQTGGALATQAGYGAIKKNVIPAIQERFKSRNDALYNTRANRAGLRYAEALAENTKLKQDRTKGGQEGAKLAGQADARAGRGYREARAEIVKEEERNTLAKGGLEANEARLKAEAKADLRASDPNFAALEAQVDAIKETTGILEETLKSEIKARKNQLLAADKQYKDARVAKIQQDFESEKADTLRVQKFNEYIEKNTAILDGMLEAKVQGSIREKAEKEPLGKRAEVRMKISVLEDQIAKLHGEDGSLRTDPAVRAKVDGLVARINKLDSSYVVDRDNLFGKALKDNKSRSAVNKGIAKQVSDGWKDEISSARESGSYYADVFKPDAADGNANTLLFRYLGDDVENIKADQAKALAAMASDLQKGDADLQVAQSRHDTLKALYDLQPLETSDPTRFNAEIQRLAADAKIDDKDPARAVEVVRRAYSKVVASGVTAADHERYLNEYKAAGSDTKKRQGATTDYMKALADKRVNFGMDKSVAAGNASTIYKIKEP